MMRLLCVAVLALLSGAAPSRAEPISYLPDDPKVMGEFVLPKDIKGKTGAVILIHEWWGLNDWMKQQAQRIADMGYAVLAVDLYHGKTAGDSSLAHELMRGLPDDRVYKELKQAYLFLRSQPQVSGNIAILGWCMGGGFALEAALRNSELRGAIMAYGKVITDPARIATLEVPLLGIFGADDRGIDVADIKKLESALVARQKVAKFKVYPKVGHAFMNENNKSGYEPTSAKLAWIEIENFLKTSLQ
jgi:carboxymethylenebutenolidase